MTEKQQITAITGLMVAFGIAYILFLEI